MFFLYLLLLPLHFFTSNQNHIFGYFSFHYVFFDDKLHHILLFLESFSLTTPLAEKEGLSLCVLSNVSLAKRGEVTGAGSCGRAHSRPFSYTAVGLAQVADGLLRGRVADGQHGDIIDDCCCLHCCKLDFMVKIIVPLLKHPRSICYELINFLSNVLPLLKAISQYLLQSLIIVYKGGRIVSSIWLFLLLLANIAFLGTFTNTHENLFFSLV